jgi:hypothetical protein
VLLAVATVGFLWAIFTLFKGTQLHQFLMPGPLTSAHGTIETCSSCHTSSGKGKLSWMYGLVAGDPHGDSVACLTCHKMPETAFNPHSTSPQALEASTKRLAKLVDDNTVPRSVRAQSSAFPTQGVVARGLFCATCHQEHQGAAFNLKKVTNEQCQSCHVVKFDSFDGHHPSFDNYPFKKRTSIIFDHAGHFGKHFPEAAKKDAAARIPATCSTCHDSRKDKRVMAVTPFDQICASCHLSQITGKERVSGPKGVAFLTLPGLDVETLRKKGVSVGEWPSESEAELTPFMKVMIGRNERGRTLIRTTDKLNLQDLANATDVQIEAVANLVWEIKRLLYALIWGRASDVLGNLNVECGAKLSADLVADLTASLPRDVVISLHQQWLPNLGREMANRQDISDPEETCYVTTKGGWVTTMAESNVATGSEAESAAKPDRTALANQQSETKVASAAVAASKPALPQLDAAGKSASATTKAGSENEPPAAPEPPTNRSADQTDDLLNPTEEELRGLGVPAKRFYKAAPPEGPPATAAPAPARAESRKEAIVERPQNRAADQTDDLLNPTEEELRGTSAPGKRAEKAIPPEGTGARAESAGAKSDSAVSADPSARIAPKAPAEPEQPTSDVAPGQPKIRTPLVSIESDIDAESWAEYGGWYRQDYAIFYRPTGHKDKFIYSWLVLTGPQAPKGAKTPAASVFDALISKDAQGSCTKCHSVDDSRGKGRFVNFSPPTVKSKQARFTNFVHEPHFGVLENRGCLTCHNLEKGAYLQSYEQGNPKNFVSNFSAVKKELCQTCHNGSMARQDCLLCHKYHVPGVITPIMSTRIPIE